MRCCYLNDCMGTQARKYSTTIIISIDRIAKLDDCALRTIDTSAALTNFLSMGTAWIYLIISIHATCMSLLYMFGIKKMIIIVLLLVINYLFE